MEDERIIDLYNARDEAAITETEIKYAHLIRAVAGSVLSAPEDREEAVNDTYLGLWNAIPPAKPRVLPAFISRVARNLSLKKFDYITAQRRSPGAVESLSELSECVSGAETPELALENRRIEAAISAFLKRQPEIRRYLFLRRYWYFDSIDAIAEKTGWSYSRVVSALHAMRQKLREHLEKEDIEL